MAKPTSSDKSFESNKDASNEQESQEPYQVLGVSKNVEASEIVRVYRRLALKYHPDRVKESQDKEAAKKRFQKIVWAYAILSDSNSRELYDKYGDTIFREHESDLKHHFEEIWSEAITKEAIEKFKKEYQCSQEEKDDILEAYTKFQGDMELVFEHVLCSDAVEDDARFKAIIQTAIDDAKVEKYKKFSSDTLAKRKRKAKREAKEAVQHAKDLKIDTKNIESQEDLAALIKKKTKARLEQQIDQIVQKYVKKLH